MDRVLQRVLLFELGQEGDVFLGGGMIWTKGFACGVGGALRELLCFRELVLAGQVAGEIEAGIKRQEMLATENFFGLLQDLAVLGFGLGKPVLVEESVGQAATAADCCDVLGA